MRAATARLLRAPFLLRPPSQPPPFSTFPLSPAPASWPQSLLKCCILAPAFGRQDATAAPCPVRLHGGSHRSLHSPRMPATTPSECPSAEAQADKVGPPAPKAVIYDSHTGVPTEFNEFLPPDCPEYKNWQAAQEGSDARDLLIPKTDDDGQVRRKDDAPGVVIETERRKRKKSVTTVTGMDAFGIRLQDAARMFGKKFACGSSVVRGATGGDRVEIQGVVVDELAEYLVRQFGSKGLARGSVFVVVGQEKRRYFEGEEDD